MSDPLLEPRVVEDAGEAETNRAELDTKRNARPEGDKTRFLSPFVFIESVTDC